MDIITKGEAYRIKCTFIDFVITSWENLITEPFHIRYNDIVPLRDYIIENDEIEWAKELCKDIVIERLRNKYLLEESEAIKIIKENRDNKTINQHWRGYKANDIYWVIKGIAAECIGVVNLLQNWLDEKNISYIEWIENKEKGNIHPKQNLDTYPDVLNTDKAQSLFTGVEALGYCKKTESGWIWTGKASLFGYFVDVASDFLNLRPDNGRIPWKLFKSAFKCRDETISTARQKVSAYRHKRGTEPEGFYDIKKLCKS